MTKPQSFADCVGDELPVGFKNDHDDYDDNNGDDDHNNNDDEYGFRNLHDIFRLDGNKSWTTVEASIMSTILTVSFYHLYNFVTTRAQKGFPISHFPISHFPIPNQVFSAEQVQSEDPRLEWRALQEDMLRQYLVTAQEDLQVRLHQQRQHH